jgi:hypothetical protein
MKRSPLNRGNKQLKRNKKLQQKSQLQQKKPLQQKKKLAPRSKKAEKLYREKRKPLVEKLLEQRPWCEACEAFAKLDGLEFFRVQPSKDLHEMATRGRTGGIHSDEWLDEDNIMCVCRNCHNRITQDNNQEATKLGFLKKGNNENN